jgi:hypothetical protein
LTILIEGTLVILGCGTRRPGLTFLLLALDTLFFETIFLFSFTTLELLQLSNLFITTSNKITSTPTKELILFPKSQQLREQLLLAFFNSILHFYKFAPLRIRVRRFGHLALRSAATRNTATTLIGRLG